MWSHRSSESSGEIYNDDKTDRSFANDEIDCTQDRILWKELPGEESDVVRKTNAWPTLTHNDITANDSVEENRSDDYEVDALFLLRIRAECFLNTSVSLVLSAIYVQLYSWLE